MAGPGKGRGDDGDDDAKTDNFESHEEIEEALEKGDIDFDESIELHEDIRREERPKDDDFPEMDPDETPFGTGD